MEPPESDRAGSHFPPNTRGSAHDTAAYDLGLDVIPNAAIPGQEFLCHECLQKATVYSFELKLYLCAAHFNLPVESAQARCCGHCGSWHKCQQAVLLEPLAGSQTRTQRRARQPRASKRAWLCECSCGYRASLRHWMKHLRTVTPRGSDKKRHKGSAVNPLHRALCLIPEHNSGDWSASTLFRHMIDNAEEHEICRNARSQHSVTCQGDCHGHGALASQELEQHIFSEHSGLCPTLSCDCGRTFVDIGSYFDHLAESSSSAEAISAPPDLDTGELVKAGSSVTSQDSESFDSQASLEGSPCSVCDADSRLYCVNENLSFCEEHHNAPDHELKRFCTNCSFVHPCDAAARPRADPTDLNMILVTTPGDGETITLRRPDTIVGLYRLIEGTFQLPVLSLSAGLTVLSSDEQVSSLADTQLLTVRYGFHDASPAPLVRSPAMPRAQLPPRPAPATVPPSITQASAIEQFTFCQTLGKGAFGKVHLVRYKGDMKVYALKELNKSVLVQAKQVRHTWNERDILLTIQHPFIVQCHRTFQTNDNVFLVMEFVRGGDLWTYLRAHKRFVHETGRFYAAEVLAALEYLHSMNIVYRDLKPENILLGERGHIKLADFGYAKQTADGSTQTQCGTPEYTAPEIIQNIRYTLAVDWWSFGILVYELLAGFTPFLSEYGPYVVYENIMQGFPGAFPSHFKLASKDLIRRLLVLDPTARLGCQGSAAVRAHQFFRGVDFNEIYALTLVPPLQPPPPAGDDDGSCFERLALQLPEDGPENQFRDFFENF